MERFKKTNINGLVRDGQSSALINNDANAYRRFLAERERDRKFITHEQEIINLKKEISDIKLLLQQLLNGTK